MKIQTSRFQWFICILVLLTAGCAMRPGGIAASNTPLDGRSYTVLGPVSDTDSRVYLLGFIPVSGANTIRDAIDHAIAKRRGDAMINVTVESYTQYWIVFSRYITRVEGDVIRFERQAKLEP